MNTQTLLNNVATINKDNGIFVNAKEFLKELRQVATAVAKPSDHRPNLTFVHVRVTENNLILEATDSHVLERANVAASIPDELVGKEFLIDGKFAKNLSKTPTKHGNQLGIYPQFNEEKYLGVISIVGGGEEFIDDSREDISVFGYPDLERVTPYLNDATVKFDVQQKEIFPVLKEIVKKSDVGALLVKDNVVKLKYSNWEKDLEFPIAVTNIVVNDEFEINFNIKKLKQRLQYLSNRENLTFRFYKNAYRPFTISRENGGLGLVCPIRVY
ncbi:hypothetical protein HHK02_01450 [Limosilactobacillus reuteri]|uniref:DNA polymerase III beta sliding clamp central domain-containing protein n=1 Tax=Limosilactobacillus reuteri TaxID=1598 RepID=A0A7L6BJS9_LIMRT|nr:hypothetical protein [Limosilactobacillus reuteri]QLQ62019.1 hypothetical protein HHK02_01450 [Limosilactobacillus reuteri]